LDRTKLPGALIDGTVHLWIADLNSWENHAGKLRTLLSDEELSRLDRLKIDNKKAEFLSSRSILRIILSMYLTEDPNDLSINYTLAGKPILPDTELQFNVSHSKDFLLCGISLTNRIGIDIQEIYPISSLDRIINNFFSPTEIQYLRSLPSREAYHEHFFAIWTAKEAYLKAVGDGIQGSFNQMSTIPESSDLKIFKLDLPDTPKTEMNWTIKSVEVSQGYSAALAFDGKLNELSCYELIPEDFFTS
jgi:4'-phosphopantetheinyl transferase